MKLCTIKGCGKKHFIKGLCHNHHELKRRNGIVEYRKNILTDCSVKGCKNKISVNRHNKFGLCPFHRNRKYKGIALNKTYGIKGDNNPRWNGGVSEYPNHYEMKKIRKQVIKNFNYLCIQCSQKPKRLMIHHIDRDKENHSIFNLIPLCPKCHAGFRIYKKNDTKLV